MDEYRKNNFPNSVETCRKIQLARRRLPYFQGEITKYIVYSKHGSPVWRTVSSPENQFFCQKPLLEQRTNRSQAY